MGLRSGAFGVCVVFIFFFKPKLLASSLGAASLHQALQDLVAWWFTFLTSEGHGHCLV